MTDSVDQDGGRLLSEVPCEEARAAFERILAGIANPSLITDDLNGFTQSINDLGLRLVPALIENMESEHPARRIAAASYYYLYATQHPEEVYSKRRMDRAGEIQLQALKAADDEKIAALYLLLLYGWNDKRITAQVQRLCSYEAEAIAMLSVAALAGRHPLDSDKVCLLTRYLRGDGHWLLPFIVGPLIDLAIWREEVWRATEALLLQSPTEVRIGLMEGLLNAGPKAAQAAPVLKKILFDKNEPDSMRFAAARTIGGVTKGKEGGRILLKALNDPTPGWVHGVVEGLVLAKHFSSAAVARLSELIEHDNATIRDAAAYGLFRAGDKALPALHALISRAQRETDGSVAGGIAMALAAMGRDAIQPLVRVLREKNVQLHAYALHALGRMESDEVISAVCGLLMERDPVLGKAGLILAVDVSPRFPEMASRLNELLETTNEDAIKLRLVTALATCGDSAIVALESLLREVSKGGSVGNAAMMLLETLGVINEVKEESERPDTVSRANKSASRFASVDRTLLESFLIVGSIIEEHGRLSYPKIANAIRGQVKSGALKDLSFGTSERNLQLRIKRLEEYLGETLLDRDGNRKAGLSLDGRKVLAEVRAYLSKAVTQ